MVQTVPTTVWRWSTFLWSIDFIRILRRLAAFEGFFGRFSRHFSDSSSELSPCSQRIFEPSTAKQLSVVDGSGVPGSPPLRFKIIP